MTPQAQRIAIAKACKWSHIENCNTMAVGGIWRGYPPTGQLVGQKQLLPDYLNDLNAMHEAMNGLTDKQQIRFNEELEIVCGAELIDFENDYNRYDLFKLVHATAAQRAEAFLRALNLWDDSNG